MPHRAPSLARVAPERLRDEFSKLVLSDWCAWGLEQARQLGLLAVFAPELLEMVGVEQQPQYHRYPVWEHSLLAMANAPAELRLRLAALLHDMGKPRCRTEDERGLHFYGHADVGAGMAARLLERLRYDADTRRRVVHLVKEHMTLGYNPLDSDATVLRMVRKVGREHLDDLLLLWQADGIAAARGGGDPAVAPALLKKRILALEVEKPPFSVRDLAVSGADVMQALDVPPGPAVGAALNWLLSEVEEGRVANDRATLLVHLHSHYQLER